MQITKLIVVIYNNMRPFEHYKYLKLLLLNIIYTNNKGKQ